MSESRRALRFTVTVIVAAALVAGLGRTVWQQLHQLGTDFSGFTKDSFHLSDFIEVPVREMDEALLDYALRGDLGCRTRFVQEAAELKESLSTKPNKRQMTEAERKVLEEIQSALDVYIAKGTKLLQEPQTKVDAKAALARVEANSSRLLALCDNMAAAERMSLESFIKRSHTSLRWVEAMTAVSLGLLFCVLALVGFSGYRELLAPLRSQLRRSQAIIERHEKLASLGTLAAGVAHEIRNPLTAINVRVHGLKRNLREGSSEHEDATVIASEIKRLEGIVQDFLQFARPAEPKFAIVSADWLLARVRTLMSGQMEKLGIDLVLEAPPDLWVRVDPQQLEQVLINLAQNAAESIEQKGSIRLRARSGSARLDGHAGPAVILEVMDTGTGIAPEVQKRLFDPFFTTKEEGTGLGLCIAARIVEQQGGALQYTTQINRGTTFSIILPESKTHPDESTVKDTAG